MAEAKATDEQLLAARAETVSTTAIAEKFGMSVRAVQNRLRRLGVAPLPHKPLQGEQDQQNLRIAPARVSTEVENGVVIVFSDAHYFPGVASTAHRALIKLIRELKPRVVVNNGDCFDGASISRYPRIGWDKKPSVIEELRAVETRLSEIEDAAKKAALVWPLGNHDARFETFLAAQAPQYEGVQGFHLKDHFPLWRACWSLWVNDSVVIKHRWKNGIHAAHNNAVQSGTTMVTGHLHSLKVTPWSDYKGVRFGVDTGTLADPYGEQFVDYTEDSPVNWRSGFVVLTFHAGRLLWPECVHVLGEGVAEFRGQILQV